MSITVVPSDLSHQEIIVDILVDAFASDPAFVRMIPQPDEANAKLRALFELQIKHQYAESNTLDIAVDDTGAVLGVALWDPPDGKHSLWDQAIMLPELIKIFGLHTAKVIRSELDSARYHPRFPHWYLYTIATSVQARGQGVGSALLEHGISRASDEAIYLEATTSRAAALYGRMGFVPLGHIPNSANKEHELAMWKPPVL